MLILKGGDFLIKKILSFLLAAALCLSLCMTVFASEPTVSVSGASAKENEVVTLKVSLKDNPGIASMKLVIDYDEKVLELKDAAVESAVTNISGSMSSANENDGKLIINWLSLTGNEFSVDGNFAEIRFRVKSGAASGDSPISVSYNADDVYNGKEVNVNFAVKDGVVKVNGAGNPASETASGDEENEEWGTPGGEENGGFEHQNNSGTGTPGNDEHGESPEVNFVCSHIWGESKITKEPTCTEAGEGVFICEICGEEKTDTVSPLGHKFGEWNVLTEPTEETAGEREHTCNLCGYSEKEQFTLNEEQTFEQAKEASNQNREPRTANEKSGAPVILIAVFIGAAVAAAGATFIAKKKK